MKLKLFPAILIFVAVWAAIYLPHLGTEELRGEEFRRVMPAVTMLKSGDWIVPRLAGEVYSNKPPLINWMVATSFRLTGIQNEWTARLPNVLLLLGFGIFSIFFLKDRLGVEKAVFLPLIFITTIAMIDKSRMAEIDSGLVTFCGFAWVIWVFWWSEEKSPWLVWTVPWMFLGIACLLKGPVHLVFWYPLVFFVLKKNRSLRELVCPAHFVGIGIMLAIFLPWMFLNLSRVPSSDETVGNWGKELAARIKFTEIDWGDWLKHPFEMVINFLPWSIPLVFAWWKLRKSDWWQGDRWGAVIRGSQIGILFGLILVCLSPTGLPRYTMPLFVPAALVLVDLFDRVPKPDREAYLRFGRKALLVGQFVILAMAIVGPFLAKNKGFPVIWPQAILVALIVAVGTWVLLKKAGSWSYVFQTCLVIGLGVLFYATVFVPASLATEEYRPLAKELADLTPDREKDLVFYVDDDFYDYKTRHLRVLYYAPKHRRTIGIMRNGSIPENAGYLIYRPDHAPEIQEKLSGFVIEKSSPIKIVDVDCQLAELKKK